MIPNHIHELLDDEAKKSTCKRRKIGCVIASDETEPLAVGHNGTPSLMVSCEMKPCPGSHIPPGSSDPFEVVRCYGIHAEVRAMLSLYRPEDAYYLYSTKEPCLNCYLMLMETPIQKIYYIIRSNSNIGRELWVKAGREVCQG